LSGIAEKLKANYYLRRVDNRLLILTIAALVSACVPTASPTPTLAPTLAANAEWTPQFTTFDDVEMALVPPGCFMMGSDDGRRDERPVFEQCFDTAFWIDRTEVTNVAFGSVGRFDGATRPRENLLWSEARDHCAARGARLPTEAEWEYAARGVESWLYPWGDTLIADNLVFDQNSDGETAPVGSRPNGASWVGALDLSGNVFEMVSSAYARYPYDAADGREEGAPDSERVYRGGINSYIDNGAGAAIRFRLDPDQRDWYIGFRCARAM